MCKAAASKKPVKKVFFLETEMGRLGIAEQNGAVSDVFHCADTSLSGALESETPLLLKAGRQIEQYLAGVRRSFDLKLQLSGTDFQQRVLKAVLAIPYGQTRSYRQIAEDVGHPRAARAVGSANRDCPISILIPCHRVIRSDGSLAGPGGECCFRDYLLSLEARVLDR